VGHHFFARLVRRQDVDIRRAVAPGTGPADTLFGAVTVGKQTRHQLATRRDSPVHGAHRDTALRFGVGVVFGGTGALASHDFINSHPWPSVRVLVVER
jgi:hypothetical protein